MSRGGIFFDRWGDLRFGWIVVLLAALVVVIIGGALAAVTAAEAAGCRIALNNRGVEGEYGGWLDSTCYVRGEDGRTLTLDQYDVKRHEVNLNG